MKMAKKFLAVVLAGVLALSVLTGCGNAASTKTIADVLSDMSKGQEIVYKADSKLNGKAKELGEYAVKFAKDHEDEGEDFDYSGELNKGIMVDIDWPMAVRAWVVPSIPQGSMLIIMSVLGAVVMPHNLFLHSAYQKDR